MMHECMFCGVYCDCDGEDMDNAFPPTDCDHVCEEYDEEDFG